MAKEPQFEDDSDDIDLSYLSRNDDTAEQRTVASRRRLRDKLASDVEAFLAGGGSISQVDTRASSELQQPQPLEYGRRPI